MTLTRPMVKALTYIVKGATSISELAKEMNKSENWVSEIISKLEKEGFVIKQRIGLKKRILLSMAPHAHLFREMIYKQIPVDYSEFMYGEKIRILSFISDSPKTTECIAKELNISRKYVQNTIPEFLKRGMLSKQKHMLLITRKGWPLLVDFLLAYRNYSELNAGILWKFEDEIIFLVNKETEIKGIETGFNKYDKYGIKHYPLKIMCYLPKKTLTKEEIFVHSLLGISGDIRRFSLAVAFYLKNKGMNLNKIKYMAMKYNVAEQLDDILSTINSKEETITLKTVMNIKRKNLGKILKLYGVELNVKHG